MPSRITGGACRWAITHAPYDSSVAKKPTDRIKFDPALAIGGLFQDVTSEKNSQEQIYEVSALSTIVCSLLESRIGRVKVKGEISNFRALNGHWYFTLKDATARIDCVMFQSAASKVGFVPKVGASVVVSALVTHYPPQGKTQLQCTRMEPAGAGDLDAQFRALCEELRTKGWFDQQHKVPIPAVPMCIAILTSAGSAAEADCLDAARRSFPATRIILVDVRVQGPNSISEIATALAATDNAAMSLGIDAILLVRGGGSIEDLWTFNERAVAQAIWNCTTPIVTGIGHESDTTIADLVADMRCATPSRAVTETLPRREALVQELDSLSRRLNGSMTNRLKGEGSRIELAARSRALSDPGSAMTIMISRVSNCALQLASGLSRTLALSQQRLDLTCAKLQRGHPQAQLERAVVKVDSAWTMLNRTMDARVRAAAERVASGSRTLEAVGPMAVLGRGYSLTVNSTGHALRSCAEVTPGMQVETIMHDGQFASTVTAAPSRSKPTAADRPQP